MALSPQNDEAFLREVDEELRREQINGLWRRYGKIAAGVLVLLLVALAAFLWWRAEQTQAAEADGETLSTAIADIQGGRKAEAEAKLKGLVADGTDGYRATARFADAALAVEKGNSKAALATYAALAADTHVGQPYRDLALIRQTALEFDTLPPAQVVARLKPLAVEGNPWFGTAGEMTAIAYIDMNKPAEAGRLLAAVAGDKTTPASLRARARRLAITLGATIPASAQKD